MVDIVTTVLELAAVVLLATAAGLASAAAVGGVLGVALGCGSCGMVLAGASAVLQWSAGRRVVEDAEEAER
jgi:hypothetical protein